MWVSATLSLVIDCPGFCYDVIFFDDYHTSLRRLLCSDRIFAHLQVFVEQQGDVVFSFIQSQPLQIRQLGHRPLGYRPVRDLLRVLDDLERWCLLLLNRFRGRFQAEFAFAAESLVKLNIGGFREGAGAWQRNFNLCCLKLLVFIDFLIALMLDVGLCLKKGQFG